MIWIDGNEKIKFEIIRNFFWLKFHVDYIYFSQWLVLFIS